MRTSHRVEERSPDADALSQAESHGVAHPMRKAFRTRPSRSGARNA